MLVSCLRSAAETGNTINNKEYNDPRVRERTAVRWLISLSSPGTAGNEISAGLNRIISQLQMQATTAGGQSYWWQLTMAGLRILRQNIGLRTKENSKIFGKLSPKTTWASNKWDFIIIATQTDHCLIISTLFSAVDRKVDEIIWHSDKSTQFSLDWLLSLVV